MGRKVAKLKRRIRQLQAELDSLRDVTGKSAGKPVSPLAPVEGFPGLPQIDGVTFAAASAGVRYSGRTDVMAARACPGSTIAGVFTRSATRSASVIDCESKLAGIENGNGNEGLLIIVNSGNANAFTGEDGMQAVREVATCGGRVFGVPETSVFTASTGVIGEQLPHEKIVAVMEDLHRMQHAGSIKDAARAIMTTDTFPKGATDGFATDSGHVTISGIAKGSGMIAPDMATMLAFIFTDADVDQAVLQQMVSDINRHTFNAITVDGDTSTSDLVLVVATGASGAESIDRVDSPQGTRLSRSLEKVMSELAQQIVRDGEGASKFITVKVTGATTREDAAKVAKSIANSPLVKTAMAGEDPNWGRVVMAVGKSGAAADRDRLDIRFGGIQVTCHGRVSSGYEEAELARYMTNDRLLIEVDLGMGDQSTRVWTCDLTERYISINADYRS